MNQLERIVRLRPAYDKRHAEPSKNYGIHGVELLMVAKGDLGAVQFLLYTNWQLPHITEETIQRTLTRGLDRIGIKVGYLPMPADLGYHWRAPRYEDQRDMGACEFCDGAVCYYDGSGLNAEPVYETLLKEGDEGVWRELEKYYADIAGRVS